MHLHDRIKIDDLEMSQGCHPTDVFSGRFKDFRRMFLENLKNKQQLTFKYFTQYT